MEIIDMSSVSPESRELMTSYINNIIDKLVEKKEEYALEFSKKNTREIDININIDKVSTPTMDVNISYDL